MNATRTMSTVATRSMRRALTGLAVAMALAAGLGGASAYAAPVPAGTDGWVWQNPKPLGVDLEDTQFVTESVGWAVGGGGNVIKTTDGGANWSLLDAGILTSVRAVCFIDPLTGWVVADGGMIARTDDGGLTWQHQATGVTWRLDSVCFVDARHGWAVGKGVLRTTDGGLTWMQCDTRVAESLYSVDFVDTTTGWAAGYNGLVLKSTDGGVSWAKVHSSRGDLLYDLAFIDHSHGWAVGAGNVYTGGGGLILSTSDGGATWKKMVNARMITDVHFLNASTGWAVGLGDYALRTTNGGRTWKTSTTRAAVPLEAVSFADALHGWAVGWTGCIVRTTDGGVSWTRLTKGSSEDILSVSFIDGSTGWALQEKDMMGPVGVVKTTDGGASWEGTPTSLPGDDYEFSYESLYFSDAIHGWVVGDGGVVSSVDGGATWVQRVPGEQGDWDIGLHSVHSVDASAAWAVGETADWSGHDDPDDQGLVLRTVDGGVTWQRTVFAAGQSLSCVRFADRNVGWTVGEDGTAFKTLDGGDTWSSKRVPTTTSLGTIAVLDANRCWIGAWGHKVFRTTDGGDTWVVQDTGISGQMTSLSFADELNGWAVGRGGAARTFDGGTTWTPLTIGTDDYMSGASFPSADEGWIVGYSGTILHYEGTVGATTQITAETTGTLTLGYGDQRTVVGTLTGASEPAAGRRVVLESAPPGRGFNTVAGETTTAANGAFSFTVHPEKRRRFRTRFVRSIEDTLASSASTTTIEFRVPAMVGRPHTPKVMRRGHASQVTGVLRPAHTGKRKGVRIYLWHWNGSWKAHGFVDARIADGDASSPYSCVVSLPHRGVWRLQAYHADTEHEPSWSRFEYTAVR